MIACWFARGGGTAFPYSLCGDVIKIKRRNLNKAIEDFNISWNTITPAPMAPTITKRYSHAAAVHGNSMYVFGGCTCSMTTFNDLWRLDLSKRKWVRPLTMGTYPSPKACGTMACYKDLLILFGGWTYPPSYPLHQTWHLFNELHTYDIAGNCWTCINTDITPPPTAGHSASIHHNFMVVFGGLQRAKTAVHSTKTNDVWKLDLDNWMWEKKDVLGNMGPVERYGHSQTALDDENIFILGGSGGPSFYYNDAWVLNMKGDIWRWIPVEVRNTVDAPSNLWCNPVCKVDDKIIVLNRGRQSSSSPLMYFSKGVWAPPRLDGDPDAQRRNSQRSIDTDENVNGRRGVLKGLKRNNPDADELHQRHVPKLPLRDLPLAAFNNPDDQQPSTSKEERRMENLRRVEEKWKGIQKQKEKAAELKTKHKRNLLEMYVLDISHALDDRPYVTWLPPKSSGLSNGPEETILYTLVEGKAELVMFGGIQKDPTSFACDTNLSKQVSNSLHFITAPKYVI
nr:F-box only protein 42-like isoform X2 [Onthophagus taurus]